MDLTTLTEQHKGKRVIVSGREVKTIESFGYKIGPSGDMNTTIINFTDGTWAYASQTEPVR